MNARLFRLLTLTIAVALGVAGLTAVALTSTPAAAAEGVTVPLAAGAGHTCALTDTGGVKCWGGGGAFLGNGTGWRQFAPVDVSGLASGVTAVAAGWQHSCALTIAGGVKCWGYNFSGQVGDGTNVTRYTPVDVSGLSSGVTAISAGWSHSCALTDAGGAKCWGDNSYGELGDGTTVSESEPVDVPGLSSGLTAISAGYYDTCAVTVAGGVKCWGLNDSGKLGDGTATTRLSPVDVVGLSSRVTAIAGGDNFTCALTVAGGVKCWGGNGYGQLGDGTTIDRSSPVEVSGLTSGVTAVAAGGSHTCALTVAGAVKCWGYDVFSGLGGGTPVRSLPATVPGLTSGVANIAVGDYYACALTRAGSVKCWGVNSDEEFGDGTNQNWTPTPMDVSGLSSGVTAIAAGSRFTCALTIAGGVKCWGDNEDGQLGDGGPYTYALYTPGDVSGLTSGVTAIAASDNFACALTVAAGVECWGGNYGAQATPVDASGVTLTWGVTATASGYGFACALTVAAGVQCLGNNVYGQLGDGTNIDRLSPVDVSGLTSGVTAISAGGFHTCALTDAGGVKCWGYNEEGESGVNPGWTPVPTIGSFLRQRHRPLSRTTARRP